MTPYPWQYQYIYILCISCIYVYIYVYILYNYIHIYLRTYVHKYIYIRCISKIYIWMNWNSSPASNFGHCGIVFHVVTARREVETWFVHIHIIYIYIPHTQSEYIVIFLHIRRYRILCQCIQNATLPQYLMAKYQPSTIYQPSFFR